MFNSKRLIALGLTGCILLGGGSLALAQTAGEPASPSPQQQSTFSKVEKTLADYLQKGMNLFSSTVETVVPYKAPEVLPNGDIIIRRAPDAAKTDPSAGTATPGAPTAANPPAPSAATPGAPTTTPVAPAKPNSGQKT